jgi:hypothetical protein
LCLETRNPVLIGPTASRWPTGLTAS